MMTLSLWKRLASFGLMLVAAVPTTAAAQEWKLVYGAGSRAEYTDNYFYTAPTQGEASSGTPESAFTLSLIPFVAAVRRTEVSEVKAIASIGANKAWGVSEEYLSARVALEGLLREERSTWTGSISYDRTSELQDVISNQQVVLVRTYTDTVSLNGALTYRLTEQWSAGTGVSGEFNRYDSVQDVASVVDDVNISANGDLRYDFSDRTRALFSLNYTNYTGDLTRSDIVTARAGIAHRYSPQLAVSASAGWYWSDTRNRSGATVSEDVFGRENGGLFGANVEYAFTEASQLTASASQSLTASGVGTISESDTVAVALTHRFSDSLRGNVGAEYARTTFPGSLNDDYSEKTIQAEVGLAWRIAEHWTMDAGYRYERTRYSLESGEPRSNVVFLTLAYNWPGAALTGWIGRSTDSKGLGGAGPLSPRDFATPGIDATSAPSAQEPQPLDPFTLP